MSPPFPRYLITITQKSSTKVAPRYGRVILHPAVLSCLTTPAQPTIVYTAKKAHSHRAIPYSPTIPLSAALCPNPCHLLESRIAASLKSYLYRIEGFELLEHCNLYLSLSEKAPLDDSTHLRLRGENAPGSFEFDPIALVVNSAALQKRSAGGSTTGSTQPFGEFNKERQYGAH